MKILRAYIAYIGVKVSMHFGLFRDVSKLSRLERLCSSFCSTHTVTISDVISFNFGGRGYVFLLSNQKLFCIRLHTTRKLVYSSLYDKSVIFRQILP
jgi:hypothetical protein